MQHNKKIYISYLLLSIYLTYFGVVSLFVHSHVYNGVVYIHSHPYSKSTTSSSELPIEAHHHTSSTFFTLNVVSNILCGTTTPSVIFDVVLPTFRVFFERYKILEISDSHKFQFNLRAPPLF